jgi:hypothetical protein
MLNEGTVSVSENKTILKNALFWYVALCRSCVNGRFGGTYRLYLQGKKLGERGTSSCRLLQPAHPGSSLADSSTFKIEALRSSEM